MPAIGKIMLIDDSELVLDRVKSRLLREGYDVITVSRPANAPNLLSGCDVVLIDLHMPGIGGGEVLSLLRKASKGLDVQPQFFLYTADKIASRRHRAAGFDGALINKGDDESLIQQLAAALRFAKLKRMTR
jgi:CheY-like chemotaxis protein